MDGAYSGCCQAQVLLVFWYMSRYRPYRPDGPGAAVSQRAVRLFYGTAVFYCYTAGLNVIRTTQGFMDSGPE